MCTRGRYVEAERDVIFIALASGHKIDCRQVVVAAATYKFRINVRHKLVRMLDLKLDDCWRLTEHY
jgi:hypothetical protein